jgi:Tfp pilus assembly protein PilP
MKKISTLTLAFFMVGISSFFTLVYSQQEVGTTKPQETIISPAQAFSSLPPRASYNPAGRRDPFKDLIGKGKTGGKVTSATGQLTIDNANLVGIVKTPKSFVAIISGPQEFPYFLKIGDRLADGYVYSIDESQVVFRKTHERGFPLMRPRNIVKEINPEER